MGPFSSPSVFVFGNGEGPGPQKSQKGSRKAMEEKNEAFSWAMVVKLGKATEEKTEFFFFEESTFSGKLKIGFFLTHSWQHKLGLGKQKLGLWIWRRLCCFEEITCTKAGVRVWVTEVRVLLCMLMYTVRATQIRGYICYGYGHIVQQGISSDIN